MVLCCKQPSLWFHGNIFVLFNISQMHYPSNQSTKFIFYSIASELYHTIMRMYTEDTVFLTKFHQSLVQICSNDCTLFIRKWKQRLFMGQNTNLGKWLFWVDDATLATNIVELFFARIWFTLYKGIGSLVLANYHFYLGPILLPMFNRDLSMHK